MIEAKQFFRKMDALLTKIDKKTDDAEFLPRIMRALGAALGEDLRITNGRLYEERGDAFVLLDHVDQESTACLEERIPLDSEAVQLVLQHGSYLFDDPEHARDFCSDAPHSYSIPVALAVVRAPAHRWIIVYDLTDEWVREEIQLSLNAVRTLLNYRLFSETIRSDLEQAAQIQRSLLPTGPPDIAGYEIAARCLSATLVGGDFYDYFRFSKDICGVSIGDASGHGLPAALVVRDVVTGLRMGLEEEMKIIYTLRKLNRVIHRSTLSSRFVSLFYGEIERNGNLLYANAGHPPPLLVHGAEVQELTRTGLILGPLPEIPLRRAVSYIEPGAVLVLYSDGIFERRNRKKEQFGLDRLKELVVAHQDSSPDALVDLIFETIFAFGKEEAWEDDATVVVIKRKKEGKSE